jgi:hypothetical protein
MMQKLVIAVFVLAACDVGPPKEDYKKVKPEDVQEKKAPPPPPKKVLTAAEMGNCHLTASGVVTADQTTPGGRPATNISYWMSPEDQKTMMGVDGFVVNCNGPDIRFSIVPGGGKQDGMPFKAKTYTFTNGKGDANIMIGLGKASVTNVNGSVDITAFDSHHIAGTVALSGKMTPGNGEEKLAGSFDLVCPGLSACDK